MRIRGNKVAIDLRRLRDELNSAALATQEQAEQLIAGELQDLLDRLNRRSTRRASYARSQGLGNVTVKDQPLKDAEVIVKRNGRRSSVFVRSQVFDALDKGLPDRHVDHAAFPAYQGSLTKPNSVALNRQRVELRPVLVVVKNKTVAGFEGRNFIGKIAQKRHFDNVLDISGVKTRIKRVRLSRDFIKLTVARK